MKLTFNKLLTLLLTFDILITLISFNVIYPIFSEHITLLMAYILIALLMIFINVFVFFKIAPNLITKELNNIKIL
jgi:hypothetical protein